jgi:hypothetical protein
MKKLNKYYRGSDKSNSLAIHYQGNQRDGESENPKHMSFHLKAHKRIILLHARIGKMRCPFKLLEILPECRPTRSSH